MRRGLAVWLGAFAVAAAGVVHAAEAPLKSHAPWSIEKLARSSDALPATSEKIDDAPTSKYLHVRIAVPPAHRDLKLHQFCITDEKGGTVAEMYGFHQGRSVLVFEGNWSRLEGLYLDGVGHRQPLVEPAAPAKPQPEKGQLHARQADPSRRPMVEQLPPEADKLYQEVLVTQRSRLNIQGLDFEGDLQYRVLSSLAIDKRNPDGSLSVKQKVEQAEVIRADPLTQSLIGELLGKLTGSTFQIAVGPDGRVVDFRGATGPVRAAAGKNLLGGQSFLMASIIDPDGWREIAELTFFRPPTASEGRQSWDRAITHGWGPLGSWEGKVVYTPAGQDGTLERTRYALKLAYQPPKSAASELPFQIARAEFKHQEAGGTIVFDRSSGRVVQAEEHFPVKGTLTIGLLGQEAPVDLQETQDFRIRILPQRPDSER